MARYCRCRVTGASVYSLLLLIVWSMRMNAPAMRDLFTKRLRKIRPPPPSELQIQISLIAQLRQAQRIRPGVIYFHVPNGELRDKRSAAKLRAMGVRAGVADLIFIWNAPVHGDPRRVRILFLELKAPGRKETPLQTLFADEASTIGCDYAKADSIDDAITILQGFGLLRY
jgi:hypothetical protein